MLRDDRREIILEATIEDLRKIYDDEEWAELYTFNKFVEQHKRNGCIILNSGLYNDKNKML